MTSTGTPFFTLNPEDWPTVTLRILRGPVNDAEVVAFERAFVAALSLAHTGRAETADSDAIDPTRLLICMNIDGIVDATADEKLAAMRIIEAVQPYVLTSIKATAIVVTQPAARTFFNVITSLVKLKSKNAVFDNEREALAWLASEASPEAYTPPAH